LLAAARWPSFSPFLSWLLSFSKISPDEVLEGEGFFFRPLLSSVFTRLLSLTILFLIGEKRAFFLRVKESFWTIILISFSLEASCHFLAAMKLGE